MIGHGAVRNEMEFLSPDPPEIGFDSNLLQQVIIETFQFQFHERTTALESEPA